LHLYVLQRTNKSFDARRWCGSRTYEYYLPASVLGLDSADGSTPEDQDRLALLREVLAAYCGYKPFQNYAGNRSQYVGQKAKG
jgi:tRNA U38,U39,U40 pseudouridine synthase TruA